MNLERAQFCFSVLFYFPCYVDIDECAMNTDNCDETLAKCSNTPSGSFTCACIAGYIGNGTTGTCMGGYGVFLPNLSVPFSFSLLFRN